MSKFDGEVIKIFRNFKTQIYILKKLFVLNFIIFPMFLSQKSLKKLTSKGEIFVQFPTVLINTILSPMFLTRRGGLYFLRFSRNSRFCVSNLCF